MSKQIAEEYKKNGNRFFQQHKYEDAINAYSRAIINNPENPTYFTNRALCFMQMMQWDRVIDDCRKALEMDRKNVKANYYLGRACLQTGQCEEAVKVLMRANDLAINQKMNFGDAITAQLRAAKRDQFRKEEEKRVCQEIELQAYLNGLMDKDLQERLSVLRENWSKCDAETNADGVESMKNSNSETLKDQEEAIAAEIQANKDMLNSLFAQVDERRRKREVPDFLCGKISFEILKEPVITPSGITYDRADIKEHLQRVGHFDPVTGVALTYEQLIPNFAMKEVVDHFLSENQWAIDA
uniref:E3 ubiquitin-protein ligase CHIP n=1 Tax=Syphacia muris TaxID=451379 RepID=A0A158R503_9BILA